MAGLPSTAVASQGQVLAGQRVLPAPVPLAPLLPGSGLRRGSLVRVSGPGSSTLLLSLLAPPLAQGSWAAVVGLGDLGLEAAQLMGVNLARVALVPDPGRRWPAVLAVLLDALDLVVVRPPGHCSPADAHRLAARAREQGSVLLLAPGGRPWPEHPDLALLVEAGDWEGGSAGSGTLRRRPANVVVSGRRVGPARALSCWLPDTDGRFAARGTGERAAPGSHEAPRVMAWAG